VTGAAGASAATRVNPNPSPTPVIAATVVADISAFPTGGPGSGSEATCQAYTQLLDRSQAMVNNETGLAQQVAQSTLDVDIDSALNAGCAVID